ncbi:MAG: bifunctional isocitrate dehydrogenase kinase/phosphatase, partial [Candidatus Eremiobacteraeota bacterium]|nr:bifunctional isocitrate dehydrogenase kinase/phosphatase [Candidatus Eremiobacteraeota bacterium]
MKRMVARAARQIESAFGIYEHQFHRITVRAQERFEQRDWTGAQQDGLERLDVYSSVCDRLVESLQELMGDHLTSKNSWRQIKDAYRLQLEGRANRELAETFYNSATRRIFSTVGVDPRIEFVRGKGPLPKDFSSVTRRYPQSETLERRMRRIVADASLSLNWRGRTQQADLLAERIRARLGNTPVDIEMLAMTFYRNKGAYLIGRLQGAGVTLPVVLALINPDGEMVVDAIILEEDELSKLLSFARSYFRVATTNVGPVVGFLKSLLPKKPVAELYISLGYDKQGKTELFRDFVRHLSRSDDRFVVARGERGMVMAVFTLPSYDVVFKMIKDRFAYPKRTTRREVMQKYRLVFKHDRVGRLVDAQEFEHLTFSRDRFEPALLEELLATAAQTIEVKGDLVTLHHAYTERRLTPLDIYLRENPTPIAREAVLDYGNCVRELALAGIFPGDMFLKNFGVTRH